MKLYTGKVVVRPTEQKVSGWKDEVYLLPGRQVYYNKALHTVMVNDFGARKHNSVAAKTTDTDNNTALVFDNTPLPHVLDKLVAHYNLTINYTKAELTGMYFSGTVLNSDSLSVILKVIGQMNGLTVTQKADGFIVRKLH